MAAGRVVVVSAHPDDETIGCGALLAHFRDPFVVEVTDGAPGNKAFHPRGFELSKPEYADLRRKELLEALAVAGISERRIFCLGFSDQLAPFHLVEVAQRIRRMLLDIEPDLVFCHAYEGGHPDHDAACFATHAALAMAARAGGPTPYLLEMASYHGRGGGRQAGRFLDAGACGVLRLQLEGADLDRKRRMMACFASQADTLAAFGQDYEVFRPAPRYDFHQRPHEGKLYYEQMGWPMTGRRFCSLARAASVALGLP